MKSMTIADESARLECLRQCAVLDTEPEQDFDDLTRLAADICGCPIAMVSLVDSDRQWFKSKVGLRVCQTSRQVAFCSHVVALGTPLIVGDTLLDGRFKDNPLVQGDPHLRFYAGIPLTLSGGHVVGTLCVADRVPRTLTPEQMRSLLALAGQARSQLELRRTIATLQGSRRELGESHDRLTQTVQSLERAQRAAQAATAARDSFLANMSHEIRTPMTAVLGFLDLLLPADASSAEQQEMCSAIRRNAQRVLGVLADVLEVSSLESGAVDLRATTFDPRAMLGEVRNEVAVAAREKQLAVDAECATEVPAALVADVGRLRQIVLYLVTNAIKFTESGGVRVRLHAAPVGACEQLDLRIDVMDTGPGIGESERSRLFAPFEQGDPTVTRRHGGAGLGLHIARRLCRSMGGDIECVSRPGEGSTFTARIRVAQAPAIAPANTEMHRRDLAGVRVLVVEDGPDNQRLLRHLLTKAGASVSVVDDGGAALDAVLAAPAGSPRFDLILMDMQMPVVDGYTATRRLRDAGVRTPIVAVTAHALQSERARCLASGCNDYQTKPIDRASLLDTCRRCLACAEQTTQSCTHAQMQAS